MKKSLPKKLYHQHNEKISHERMNEKKGGGKKETHLTLIERNVSEAVDFVVGKEKQNNIDERARRKKIIKIFERVSEMGGMKIALH